MVSDEVVIKLPAGAVVASENSTRGEYASKLTRVIICSLSSTHAPLLRLLAYHHDIQLASPKMSNGK